MALLLLLAALCAYYYKRSRGRVYLLDFACYKPPKSLQVTMDAFLWGSMKLGSVCPCDPLYSLQQCTPGPQSFHILVSLLSTESLHSVCTV